MADARLEVVLAGKNTSDAAFKKFESNISGVSRAANALKVGLASMAVAGSAAALAGLSVAFSQSVKNASNLAEAMGKINALFGTEGGDALRGWASNATDVLGMSSRAALDAAGAFGNMFLQLGAGGAQAASLSKEIVQLSGDIAAFNNVQGGAEEVSNAMQSAFRGEYDALQRYIPTITAAAVEQRALADSKKRTKDELTALDKALATYKIMLEGAGTAIGTLQRESNTYARQTNRLRDAWEDFSATLGQRFLPAATASKSALADLLVTANAFLNLKNKDIQLDRQMVGVNALGAKWMAGNSKYWSALPNIPPALSQLSPLALKSVPIRSGGGYRSSIKPATSFYSYDDRQTGIDLRTELEAYKQDLLNVAEKSSSFYSYDDRQTGIDLRSEYESFLDDQMKALEDQSKGMIKLTDETARAMQDGFSTFFFDAFTGELDDLGDYADSIFKSIARAAASYMGQMVVFGADGKTGGLFGSAGLLAGIFHSGGKVGYDMPQSRSVNPLLFAGAPRLHGGLMPDEFPAILQRGETVLPRGYGGGAVFNMQIVNNSGAKVSESRTPNGSGGFDIEVLIDQAVADKLGRRGSMSNKVLRNTYGAREGVISR